MNFIVQYSFDEFEHFSLLGVKNIEEYYNKYHKKDGVLFEKEIGVIYYVANSPVLPMEGQRVGTKFGVCIVTYSYLELEIGENYDSKPRIIVEEE